MAEETREFKIDSFVCVIMPANVLDASNWRTAGF